MRLELYIRFESYLVATPEATLSRDVALNVFSNDLEDDNKELDNSTEVTVVCDHWRTLINRNFQGVKDYIHHVYVLRKVRIGTILELSGAKWEF